MSGHTKTPWGILGDDEFDGVPFIEISSGECPSPEYRSVCHVQPTIDAEADSFELDAEARANAAFIVRAVNSHDEMLAVLSEALAMHGTEAQFLPDEDEPAWCAQARAAISRATATP